MINSNLSGRLIQGINSTSIQAPTSSSGEKYRLQVNNVGYVAMYRYIESSDAWEEQRLLIHDDFYVYQLKGITDAYGQINNPKPDYCPIVALTTFYTINGTYDQIRVVNTIQQNVELAKNTNY